MSQNVRPPLFQTNALRRRFDTSAATFCDADFLHSRCFDGLLERLEPVQLEPRRILDIGSATGRGSRALAKRWRGAQVLNLDLSLQMLGIGRKGRSWFSKVRDVQADAHALPFVDGCVDLAVANLSLPWLARPETGLAEIGRVLRKDGLFVFATLGPDTFAEIGAAWSAADRHAHVHPFADMHDIGDTLLKSGMSDPVLDVERVTITYADSASLYRDLRRAGSTNLLASRFNGLTGRTRFDGFEAALAAQGIGGKISVTVELVFGHAWARGARQTPQEFRVDANRIGRMARKP